MQRVGDPSTRNGSLRAGLFFSPSDLNHFVECEHLTSLDLLAINGFSVEKSEKEKVPQGNSLTSGLRARAKRALRMAMQIGNATRTTSDAGRATGWR